MIIHNITTIWYVCAFICFLLGSLVKLNGEISTKLNLNIRFLIQSMLLGFAFLTLSLIVK